MSLAKSGSESAGYIRESAPRLHLDHGNKEQKLKSEDKCKIYSDYKTQEEVVRIGSRRLY
jgi:hypothetical protein